MIVRIVKMSFHENEIERFIERYYEVEPVIASFTGCNKVELLRDIKDKSVFFTYSEWDSEDHLNQYRGSEFFNETWQWTRQLFNEKPVAWSLQEQERIK